jgi:glycosyltransferase involved in cell wall biosynthesis
MKQRMAHVILPLALTIFGAMLRMVRRLAPRPRPARPQCEMLLTGAFQSDAWISHHLLPLSRSGACARVTMVAASPMAGAEKVHVVCPPDWLVRIAGSATARLMVFAMLAVRTRPDIVGGFHLLFNGLAAALIAPLVGARSLYLCVGGPMEVVDGGIWAENKVFNLLKTPSRRIENLLVGLIAECDIIVTMGTKAAVFMRERGVKSEIHVIPGGLDAREYAPSGRVPTRDVVFVGRLAPIKRLDLLLGAIALARRNHPDISVAIVGDGPLRAPLERMASDLGLAANVVFEGHRSDVSNVLAEARIFVLTSDTEGVSLSVMEALACGVPAVVSNVGDLADIVVDGQNGFLVNERTPEAFAARISEMLSDEPRRQRFAREARLAASRYETGAITGCWDVVLGTPASGDAPAPALGGPASV